ncbi:MAG: hypothetical protein FRX49_12790 [Trebouxia sp. A1-2]|nr:MAG: hypothetical protein FRX49_12790 [Trebouxia sp. A1-2]
MTFRLAHHQQDVNVLNVLALLMFLRGGSIDLTVDAPKWHEQAKPVNVSSGITVMLGKYCRQVFQPKRSSSKNRAGIAYATDPPLIKRGAG